VQDAASLLTKLAGQRERPNKKKRRKKKVEITETIGPISVPD
jgi:hypothetical protein